MKNKTKPHCSNKKKECRKKNERREMENESAKKNDSSVQETFQNRCVEHIDVTPCCQEIGYGIISIHTRLIKSNNLVYS